MVEAVVSNQKDFGKLTPRMNNFREDILETPASICADRAVLATEAYKENEGAHVYTKRAKMLENILDKMEIFIEDETLLVGNQASKNRAAPVFPEYTLEFVMDELDDFAHRDGDVFQITEETKEKIRDIAPFWDGKGLRDYSKSLLPDEIAPFLGFFGMEGKMNSGDGHISVNYGTVAEKGLKFYEERTMQKLNGLDLTHPDSIDKYHFYKSILTTIKATKNYANRYSTLALSMAETASPNRAEELKVIADITSRVPYEPAQNFYEALQSIWLIQIVLQLESNGHSYSFGRMDQYLFPFFNNDIKSGVISEEEATQLLTNLWIKTHTINKLRSESHTKSSAGMPLYQNVTIGGQTKDRKDAVNDLSYAILRSVAQTKLPQPNLTVRYHANHDPIFMNECIEVVNLGFGMPAFNNDEIIVPSFIDYGVSEEDALDYCAIGCVETAVPGKWGYRCTGMSYLNFPKILLITMNDGVDPSSKLRFSEGYGHFVDNFESYDDLLAAWDKIIRELTRMSVIVENSCDLGLERMVPDIFCSALVDDCIERGKPAKEGGTVYDFISGLQVGIANMADSLAAIKKLVYQDKVITRQELWDALLNDFQDERGKEIQHMLIHDAPKYGNDDDSVDELIIEAYSSYIEEIDNYPNMRHKRGPIGGKRYAGTSSITANVGQGGSTMATPDGRNAWTPLAEGCSPSHGMDRNGPTGVFKSVGKLDTRKIVGGVLLNQKVNPQTLTKDSDKEKLIALLRTFFNRLFGYHVQFNVVSRETLLDAQEHPEKHRDLIVRVAGYSAFFNTLSTTTQNDIIARTEHSL